MSKVLSMSMFFLSFVPLWAVILFVDIKSLCDGGGSKYTEIISIFLIAIGMACSLAALFIKMYAGSYGQEQYRIEKAVERKNITTEYILSNILPLFVFDFTLWYEVVKFLVFFVVFGYLCIFHNNFSVNIVLEFMRYKMYDCKLINEDNQAIEKIVISKKGLTVRRGEEITTKIINNEVLYKING